MPKRNQGARLQWREDRENWEIIWFERGQRRRNSTGTGDRREADKILGQWLLRQEEESVGPSDPSQRRVSDALAKYAEERGPQATDGARIGYAVKALLPYWGTLNVGDIREGTCRAYGRMRGVSDGTIRRELTTLRAAINHDFKEGRLKSVVSVWLPPMPEHKDRWLSRDEAASLLRAARAEPRSKRHLSLYIILGLYTGARKEAILSLCWPQVDLKRGLIDFNPPGRERTSKGRPIIRIPRRLMTFLRHARKRGTDMGPVVTFHEKRVGNIKKAFMSACKLAGLDDVTPHTLRHTCATWMTAAGVPFPVIARYLGHSDSRVTESVYSHHAPDYLDAAADALDRRGKRS